MDLLSNVLAGLQQESVVFCHATLTAPWGFCKARLDGAPFHAITTGRAWVILPDNDAPYELGPGDFMVIPRGDAHVLACEPDAAMVSFTDVLANRGSSLWQPGKPSNGLAQISYGGGGATTTLVSGVFAFADRRHNPLVAALPQIIHIRSEHEHTIPWLSATLRYLAEEAAADQPGAAAVTARLADVLFIQAIRAHIVQHPADTSGWLRGMTDKNIGHTLACIHANPAKSWTVALLAEQVGVSRSGFAARFKALVGQGPIEYLTNWRMHEAAGLLLAGTTSLADVAEQVGYQSEAAFAKAFKRWSGQSPRAYRASSDRA